ncbi:MAG: cytochrome c oxidase subunit II [Methylovirgula sp.]
MPHTHALLATIILPRLVDAPTPLTFMRGYGSKTYPVTALTWGLLAISIIVVIIITGLVVVGVWRRRARSSDSIAQVPVNRGASGVGSVAIAVGISSLVLLGSVIWTVVVLADINAPAKKPALTIEVTGQQWWWKARYLSDDPSRVLTTANEIHIPTGEPIRIKLLSADVLHSFWVPALTGKTQTVPGLTNTTWLEADRPGVYAGQCTEYCGTEHSHMGFLVVAQKPAAFKAWLNAELKPAAPPPPSDATALQGEKDFVFHCGTCHTVRGTDAGGTVAPDLTHVMSRAMLAANTLRNTPANLAGWIADPQAQKPGTKMPTLYLSGPQLNAIVTYVRTLK